MSGIYQNSIADERVRRYLPCTRITASSGAETPDALVGNLEKQIFLWGKKGRVCKIAPQGFILLDFGIELHGGVRLLSENAGHIRVRFGESAGEAMSRPDMDHSVHDAELLLPANGLLEYGSTAFRFVRIDNAGSETLVFQNIMAVALFRDLSWDGSFVSSDERLNRRPMRGCRRFCC